MKTKIFCVFMALVCLAFCGCAQKQTSSSFVMNTVFNQTVYGSKEILRENEQIAAEIENEFSRTKENTEIYNLNANKEAVLSENTLYVLKYALEVSKETDGALDVTLGGVSDLWDIQNGGYVPTNEEINSLLQNCGSENIKINGDKVTVLSDCTVDLGAVVKGYALDRLAENIRTNGASGIVDLGGSIAVVGSKSFGDFSVGIKDPFDTSQIAAKIKGSDVFISTSGIYERYFEQNGKRYHHILDPKTGKPVENGTMSVTVINESGIATDAYSTALFVMGAEKGIKFANEKGIDALFINSDKKVYATKGFSEKYSLELGEEYEACF